MKLLGLIFGLFFWALSWSLSWSQTICNPNGNLIVYSNYDGGILTINVNQNIPNLKIGICTYEPIQVNFTGVFLGNVTQVIYAGFNSSQNNNNCSLGNFPTSISGINNALVTISPPMNPPAVGFTPQHQNGSGPWGGIMIGASGLCDTLQDAGGVNTPDEIVYYFQQATGASLRYHYTQYACWQNEELQISQGGNCCIVPPTACPNPPVISAQILQTTCAYDNGSIQLFLDNLNQGSFSWTPSVSNNNSADSLSPGTYQISGALGGCLFDTTLIINSSSGITGANKLITAASCNQSNGTLEVSGIQGGTPPYVYTLSNVPGQAGPFYTNLNAGAYFLIIEDANSCQWSTNVSIPALGAPSFIQTEIDSSICLGSPSGFTVNGVVGGTPPYVITVNGALSSSLTWSLTAGTYNVLAVDVNGCEWSQLVQISEGSTQDLFIIPNVITPNGDLVNQQWCLDFNCWQILDGGIYSRWGSLISVLSPNLNCWEGKLQNGMPCEEGVYFYNLRLVDNQNQIKTLHGPITLIR